MLTIGISTVRERKQQLIEYLNSNKNSFSLNIQFLIVSQKETTCKEENVAKNIKLFLDDSVGLSKSRNLVIQNTETKWLWIQDDDIDLDFIELNKLCESLIIAKNDVNFVKIKSSENKSEFYKNYNFHNNHLKLNALKISSIEIIVNTEFVTKNGIRFDQKLGLGTDMPCCEENKFVLDLFNHEASFAYLDISPCFHTTILENRMIDNRKRFIAKGYFLRNITFPINFILMLRWAYKIDPQMKFFKKLYLMLGGYIKQ